MEEHPIFGSVPLREYLGHDNNIFHVSVDRSNKYLYSCGLDGLLFRFDVEIAGHPVGTSLRADSLMTDETSTETKGRQSFIGHSDAIYKLDLHPTNENMFLSCSEDGSIRGWDSRLGDPNLWTLNRSSEQSSVAHHPQIPFMFLASSKYALELFDSRYLRLDASSEMTRGTRKQRQGQCEPMIKYNIKLSKSGSIANPHITSVTFHSSGNYFLTSMQHFLPTIYLTDHENPLVSFYAPNYVNKCTIKNYVINEGNSYVFDGQPFIACGSDNYQLCLFPIPKVLSYETSPVLAPTTLEDRSRMGSPYENIYFYDAKKGETVQHVIQREPPPLQILKHYKSNVNMTAFHPILPIMASSGVEKGIHIHSALPSGELNTSPKLTEKFLAMDLEEPEAHSMDVPGTAAREGPFRQRGDTSTGILRLLVLPLDTSHRETGQASMEEDESVFRFFDYLNASEHVSDVFTSNEYADRQLSITEDERESDSDSATVSESDRDSDSGHDEV